MCTVLIFYIVHVSGRQRAPSTSFSSGHHKGFVANNDYYYYFYFYDDDDDGDGGGDDRRVEMAPHFPTTPFFSKKQFLGVSSSAHISAVATYCHIS